MLSRDYLLRLSTIASLLLGIVLTARCSRSDANRDISSANARIGTEAVRSVAIGEVVRAAVAGDEPLICAYETAQSRSGGPCRRFRLWIPEAGLLHLQLTWDDALPLKLEL